MSDTEPQQYWFNSRTGEVELGPQSNAIERIGPFATEAEARRAPEVLRERSERWASEDASEQ